VLQDVVVCCSVLQLQFESIISAACLCNTVLQCVAVCCCCTVFQCVAVCCCCSVLQYVAVSEFLDKEGEESWKWM